MDPLQIRWSHHEDRTAVWETEHMFGFDVMWGLWDEDVHIPTQIITRTIPLGPLGRVKARMVLVWRNSGRHDIAAGIVHDLALETDKGA